MASTVQVRLSHPLSSAFAVRLGLVARDYQVGELVTVSASDGQSMIVSGYAVLNGTVVTPPAAVHYLSEADLVAAFPTKTAPVGAALAGALAKVVALPFAATLSPNADTTDILSIGVLTGAATVAAPTGTPIDGQQLRIRAQQDATGGRVLTWNAAYGFGTDVTAAMIPTTANAKWEALFMWNAADAKWRAVSLVRGF